MAQKLSVNRVINCTVNLSQKAVGRRNFGALLICGPSDVIDHNERIRSYGGLDAVAADFGITTPEYAAAEVFFSQKPRPKAVYIGRFVKAAAPATLRGAMLTSTEAAISNWTGITAGTLDVMIGGASHSVTGLDFSGAVTLEGIAEIINAALTPEGASCAYDGSRFLLTSVATGASATIGYASGTLATQMKLTDTTALAPVVGADAETPEECAITMADKSNDWYGLAFADPTMTPAEHMAVSSYIEASSKSRIYAITETDTRTLDAAYTEDCASLAKTAGYERTHVCYSSKNPHAVVSAIARAFTVNFSANKSTITLKFKQLVGIPPENLGNSHADALEDKNCNVFAAYDNDSTIYQEGVMANGAFFDEVHGSDWLQNTMETELYNLVYQSETKIPQTDSGTNQFVVRAESVLGEADNNGLIAPGIWNGDPFAELKQGDRLDTGYYIYMPTVDSQAQSVREQRICPPMQIAVKYAGAIHAGDVIINVNR
jgi:hypothetical protein